MRKVVLAALVLAFLVGLSPLAADPVISRGIDVFTTVDNGSTFYSFADNPIPKGFFCKRSAAFAGRLTFKGLPLESKVPGQLRGADTIVERLDDATFNADGTAQTRIRVSALSLVSSAPLKTACGAYHVYVTLAGEQRETTMRIVRTEEAGGSFYAPLAIDARLSFIPVRQGKGRANARPLELTARIDLPSEAIPWSFSGPPQAKRVAAVTVDTDGDLRPDTQLSGTSNFAPGWSPNGLMSKAGCTYPKRLCEPEICHEDGGEQHCTGPLCVCSTCQCP